MPLIPLTMKNLLTTIIERELGDTPCAIKEILGLGIVNEVYEISGNHNEYVVRINAEGSYLTEYKKEAWCLREIKRLNVKCPKVLAVGQEGTVVFMVQEKIKGENGSLVADEDKLIIWKKLGRYASRYNSLPQIDVAEVNEQEFHESWRARLQYNLDQLTPDDRLLKRGGLTAEEQQQVRSMLQDLEGHDFTVGLVHGDTCPRNVIMAGEEVFLLDWGTAEINVIPHHEIGLVLLSREANAQEFEAFLTGYGLSNRDYEQMLPDILRLNLLHRLDKYRWAESYDQENIEVYEQKMREAFEAIFASRNDPDR